MPWVTLDARLTPVRADHVAWDSVVDTFGFTIEDLDTKVYYAGDTTFVEPELLNVGGDLDVLIVPVSNRGLVMGVDDAVFFAQKLRPEFVIPVHCDSPKDAHRNLLVRFRELAGACGPQPAILEPGETFTAA